MWAGFANRALGDNFCEAVIDGGPIQPIAEFYTRAEGHFTTAITRAQAAGNGAGLVRRPCAHAHDVG